MLPKIRVHPLMALLPLALVGCATAQDGAHLELSGRLIHVTARPFWHRFALRLAQVESSLTGHATLDLPYQFTNLVIPAIGTQSYGCVPPATGAG